MVKWQLLLHSNMSQLAMHYNFPLILENSQISIIASKIIKYVTHMTYGVTYNHTFVRTTRNAPLM